MRRLSFRRGALVAASLAVSATTFSPGVGATGAQLPNLRAKVPFGIYLSYADESDFTNAYEALRFTMGTSNVGPHHLDVLGAEPAGAETTKAAQCVAWNPTLPRVCDQRQDVGFFTFHPLHRHWHFDDFARYELRKVTKKGAVDMSSTGLVTTSGKVSFCLEDTDTNEPGNPNTEVPFYVGCLGVYQGISAGWSDHYTGDLPGQQLVVKDVPDGTYALVVRTNPANILLETDYTDNTAVQKVKLTTTSSAGCTTTRTVDLVN